MSGLKISTRKQMLSTELNQKEKAFSGRLNMHFSKTSRKRIAFAGAIFLMLLITVLAPAPVFAQGDGPRSQLLLPVGMNVLVPTWVHLSGNYTFAGNILLPGADVKPDVFVFTYMRAFEIGNHYAQIYINPIFGRIEGEGTVNVGGQPRTFSISESGFADPIVTFKFGLIGTPPLRLPEFVKHPQSFQFSTLASVLIPIGDYDSERFLNLGINIWAVRLGTPMVAPLFDPKRPWFLEVIPSVTFYSDNNDPTGDADIREQDPLFALENHFSHNFTPKFWASFDLRYRYGGETTTDGIKDDNTQDVLGAGFTLGYALTSNFSIQASYGNVLTESDGSELEMVRVKGVITF